MENAYCIDMGVLLYQTILPSAKSCLHLRRVTAIHWKVYLLHRLGQCRVNRDGEQLGVCCEYDIATAQYKGV